MHHHLYIYCTKCGGEYLCKSTYAKVCNRDNGMYKSVYIYIICCSQYN